MVEIPSSGGEFGRVDRTPLPRDGAMVIDPRVVEAWRVWLGALATDAEAALAAAMAYQALDGAARDRWIRVLEQDAERLGVPRIALYAPLLAVESDPERRRRIAAAMGPEDVRACPRCQAYALRGVDPGGLVVAMVVMPLYLEFVQVLACAYAPGQGLAWVKHDPIVSLRQAPARSTSLNGVALEQVPLSLVVDELAEAILAHRRRGRDLPEALRMFADLFGVSQPDGRVSGLL